MGGRWVGGRWVGDGWAMGAYLYLAGISCGCGGGSLLLALASHWGLYLCLLGTAAAVLGGHWMATNIDTLADIAPRQAHQRHFLGPIQLHPSISVIPAFEDRQLCWRQLGSFSVVQ